MLFLVLFEVFLQLFLLQVPLLAVESIERQVRLLAEPHHYLAAETTANYSAKPKKQYDRWLRHNPGAYAFVPSGRAYL